MVLGANTEARDNDGYTPEDLAKASEPTPLLQGYLAHEKQPPLPRTTM